jgi:endo-beta-N-acetylglucosaminidase D
MSLSITDSLIINSQSALDAKTYALTLAAMRDLGTGNTKPFTYYEGLKVYCNEDKTTYKWREVEDGETNGLIAGDFTYPSSSLSFGVDYSGRTFNFFPTEDVDTGSFKTLMETYMKEVLGVKKIIPISQADYDALPTPRDPDILYLTPKV